MNLITLNRFLNFLASAGALAAGASAAGQVPGKLAPWASLLAVLGTIAAKYAKTPSQAIAAAVKTPSPAGGAP